MEMLRVKTLQEEIIPSVINRFGDDVKLVKCEVDENQKGEAHYVSIVLFAKVTVSSGSGVIKQYPVVVKYEIPNEGVRAWMKLDEQSHNEVYMYEILLPFLDRNGVVEDLFPKLYYGVSTLGQQPEKDILIMQDLRDVGYRLSEEKLFLDYEHVVLAMKSLGRFHALSYAAKQSNPKEFLKKAKGLLEMRFSDDKIESNYYEYKYGVERAVQPFLEQAKYTDIIKKFEQKLKNTKAYFDDLMKPDEHMGVICHGDYCRYNVLYKYNDVGRPVSMKMFDVAAARFSSPVIDISLFLFMNTTSELRRQHWDDFLSAYHEALRTELPGDVVPTLEDVHEEMRKKAVFGFLNCSFWLPYVTSDVGFDPYDSVKLPLEERGKRILFAGDETDTRYVSDIFEDLVQRNCVL